MNYYAESEIKISEVQSDMEIRFMADCLGGDRPIVSIDILNEKGKHVLVDSDKCYKPFSLSIESTKVLISYLQTLVNIYEK